MSSHPRTANFITPILLLAILTLATYLRMTNLANNPGWYTDEGTHLDIARHLLEGHVRYLAVNQSTLLFAKLPAFDLLLAGLMRILGVKITTLRLLTGCLGVMSTASLYGMTRSIVGKSRPALPLLVGLIAAIMPRAVLYSRFGFSYNLLAPMIPMIVLGLFRYLESRDRRWLAVSALLIGLGSLSDLLMLVFLVPMMLVVSSRSWRDLLGSTACALLPFFLLNIFMLVTIPQAWLFDLRYTLFRLNGMTWIEQLGTLAQNIALLVLQDTWIALGLVGLLILRPVRLRNLSLLLFLLPLVIIGRTVPLTQLSAYYLIPLLPFLALGIGALLDVGIPTAAESFRAGTDSIISAWQVPRHDQIAYIAGWVMAVLLVSIPIGFTIVSELESSQTLVLTEIDPFLINGIDAQQVANYINANARPEDVVIASPAVAWLLDVHAADFQMAAAAEGAATPHLPGNIPPNRFVFDPRFDTAHYVVVDNLWRNWAGVNIPQVYAMLLDLQSWDRVFSAGPIEVYENPSRQPTSPP